jgi:DNA phosphorothioation-dependent restriction protein DptG
MLGKTIAVAVTALSTFAIAACGGDSNDSEAHENVTPAVALKEAGETSEALTAALATYKSGDHAAAEDAVAEAYLQHFEEVEGPLEERDEELNEELEEAINEKLRDAMKAGKPDAEVESQVQAIVSDLEKAQAALR